MTSVIRQWGMVLLEIVVPVAGYYVLRAFGMDVLLALALCALPTVLFVLYRAIRLRKVDTFAIFVLTIFAVSVGVSFVTGSPRFMLAKAGWFTGAIGAAFLVSLLFTRPLAFTLARSMLARSPWAETLRATEWNDLWPRHRWFRRAWRVATVLWGVGLLADAAGRVLMAYALPVDAVPALGTALYGVTFVAVQVMQHLYFRRVGLWRRLAEKPVHT
ncbi:VC0807 family protein [Amycolatopsis pittospori]|uniref:VC0807 family protein n=1 Tax=Amycolatopsis pittospori TaxID=2749434 RepID=UPI0015F009D6|nr:VC0807 family protein [Amycolatopsis pittospori]